MTEGGKKVVVIGGGITGLSSALEFVNRKYNVVLIEKNNHVGGMSASFKYKKFILDYGPHKLYSTLPGIMPYYKKILGDSCLAVEKKNSIRLNGKYLSFPPKIIQLLTFSPFLIFKCGFGYFISLVKKIVSKKEIKTYEDYFINGFGKQTYELIFRDYAFKVWGDPKELSEEIGRKRVPVPNVLELLTSFLKKKQTSELSAKYFYYPKYGMQQFADLLMKKIEKKTGEVKLNSELEKVHVFNNRVKYVSYIEKKKNKKIETDWVISTIHLIDLVGSIEPAPPKEIFLAAKQLRFRALILVYMIVNKKRVMKDNWLFFPEKEYIFNRVSELNSFSNFISLEGKTVILAEITTNFGSRLYNSSDKEISEMVFKDLEKADILKRKEVEEVFTRKAERVYPIYSLDYKKNLNKVLNYLNNINGLYTIGRQGLFNYNNTDHCIDMGMKTVNYIASNEKKQEWKKILAQFDKYKIVD